MKVIFMGTPDFAETVLEEMLKQDFLDIVAVVTQPDKPKGRGKKIQFSEVKELAIKNNIEVLQPKRIKDLSEIEILKKYNPDIIVVVAYGQILSKEILEIPKLGCINVHGSLLPKYRGAAPIHRAIINGETKTGITIMYMNEGLDTGDIILKSEINIGDDATTGDIYPIMASLGGSAIVKVLKNMNNGIFNREPQDDSKSSYANLLKKEEGKINWNETSINIKNLVRGFTPWPGSFSILNNTTYKILKCEICNSYENGKIGEIVDIIKNKGIVVKTSDGGIIITRLQKQGKKPMDTEEFLKGNKINIGDIFEY